MPGKSQNYQKLVKDASNLASFYGSHIDGIVCVIQQIGLGSARALQLRRNWKDFNFQLHHLEHTDQFLVEIVS